MSQIQKYLDEGYTFVPAVICLPVKVNSEGKVTEICLGKRIKVSEKLGEGIVAVPGGRVGNDPGFENETYEEAAARELLEEIGIIIDPNELIFMGDIAFLTPHKPSWSHHMQIFMVSIWEGEPTASNVMEPRWYEVDMLPRRLMWPDNLLWLPEVLKGRKVHGKFLFNEAGEFVEIQLEFS